MNTIVIGNWKMHKTAREAAAFIERVAEKIEGYKARAYLAVPFTSIATAATAAKRSQIQIGAQNMHDEPHGAFTGEISSLMLREAGASFVLLGHSERRHLFGESDAFIHKKLIRALQDDLHPVLCVGETLEEREKKKTEAVIRHQLDAALKQVPKEQAEKLMIAYEPVWAIGTGKTATPQMAQEVHAFCRAHLNDLFGKRHKIPLLYGGSVKPDNIQSLVSEKDIDGVLVGGASLEPDSFITLIQHCEGIR